jgi:hypothetical protein
MKVLIQKYEEERSRKRSIDGVTDGAREDLEGLKKLKKRTVIEEY